MQKELWVGTNVAVDCVRSEVMFRCRVAGAGSSREPRSYPELYQQLTETRLATGEPAQAHGPAFNCLVCNSSYGSSVRQLQVLVNVNSTLQRLYSSVKCSQRLSVYMGTREPFLTAAIESCIPGPSRRTYSISSVNHGLS